LDKLAFFAKSKIRLELKLEHCSFQSTRLKLELPSIRSNSSN